MKIVFPPFYHFNTVNKLFCNSACTMKIYYAIVSDYIRLAKAH